MWTTSGTVPTVSSRAMIAACDRLGLDTKVMLDAVGIRRETLDDPRMRASRRARSSALWTKAYGLSRARCCRSTPPRRVRSGSTYWVIDYAGLQRRDGR